MDDRGTVSAVTACSKYALDTKSINKPPARPATISAAAVFKKRKLNAAQLLPGPRSPQRLTVEQIRRNAPAQAVHPLAVAFRETSEEYRRHLYATAVTRINKDLDTLLNKLYESNLQTVSSDPVNDSQGSPLKLTAPAKYQRLVQKLCSPLSSHIYIQQQTRVTGEVDQVQLTLHDRFKSFEEKIRTEVEEVETLQRQWEGVVAEIFQLGVACLGVDNMAALLSTAACNAGEAQSTSFFSQHGRSVHGEGSRKRVSFAGPDVTSLFPSFLVRPSGQLKSVPASAHLPAEEAQHLEQAIADLGEQHVLDLHRLEKEHQAWWKKKQTQLAHTFLQD